MIEILDNVIDLLKQRGVVQRERTPFELVVYGIYLTVLGLSLRRTKRALEPLKAVVSHVAIWKWVHKLGDKLKDPIFSLEEMPVILIVDETEVQIGDREGYVWVAINPYNGKIVYMMLSFSRTSLVALLFFQRMIRVHGGRKPKIVITDGGKWYPYPLKRLGIQHEVFHGGVRSYVESIIGVSIKDLTRRFDNYFPCSCRYAEHVKHWLYLFAFFHNVACFVKGENGKGSFFGVLLTRIKEVMSC